MNTLILDIGSSSVRALWMDDAARSIPGAAWSRPVTFDTDQTGKAQLDAQKLRESVELCIDAAAAHPAAQDARAVGMAMFVGNLVGLDASGAPITPVYTYADTRSADDAQALSAAVPASNVLQRTGCRVHTAYHPAKLAWLRRTSPALADAVACWADFSAYCFQEWLGQVVCSTSVASWGGLLDRRTNSWDADWLGWFGLTRENFPRLVDASQPCAGLTPAYRARWPALATIPFYPAVGDGTAANIGMGAVTRDALAISMGTTSAMRMLFAADAAPTVPEGLWCYRLDAGRHLLGGAATEGGGVFAWLTRLFPGLDMAAVQAELMARPVDSHGLTMLPMLNGERSPGWRADAVGTLHGLRAATTPEDIVQAALESVALRLSLIAAQMPHLPERITAGGGALAGSPVWARYLCAALGRPIHLVAEAEPTARGVALLLGHYLERHPLDALPPQVARVIAPQADDVARLAAARDRQRALYAILYPAD
ncbi:MAG: hypothetical protein KME04_06235 [Pleurocapsa minor GSE-CHR-MK-17-07R]|jgi:gluconokinase|nr:hypothetical protein [Pleurocapsa minor GSE-CHR-MK 17-07R]